MKKANNLIERIWGYIDSDGNSESDEFISLPEITEETKRFLDEIPGGFLIYHADGNEDIIYANKALLQIFGCKDEAEFKKYTGNSFKGIVHPEDLPEVEKSIVEQATRDEHRVDNVEYRIIDVEGNVKRIEDYGHLIENTRVGDIFYVFLTDITEKFQRIENEKYEILSSSREKEKKLQSLIKEYDDERRRINQEYLRRLEVIEGLSVNYDSILYVDLKSDRVMPYRLSVRTSKQFGEKLRPLQYSDYVDDYVKSWVHPEDAEMILQMKSPEYIRARLADSTTYYANYRCIVNGKTMFMQLRIVNVGNTDDVSQIVVGYRNVDEEFQQELQHMQLLEGALKNAKQAEVAKNAFLSNMSHDMRTPLNAIFGYTKLAMQKLDDKDTIRDYFEKIETAGNTILELVENVLDISERESRNTLLNEYECNLFSLVDEVKNFFSVRAESKGIRLSASVAQAKHCVVVADGQKIKQVLVKLVSNAVKYTGAGGKVEISLVEKETTSNGFVKFDFIVKDTGIGIEKRLVNKLFQPFARAKNTTGSGVFGTGLGLTIAKSTVDLMDGHITVDSETGKGSTFTVSLKLRLPPEHYDNETDAESLKERVNGRKILIVDDNEINLEIETDMLEYEGFAVETAVNGAEAVEKIRSSAHGEYALVLMDIQMPVMDGREAATEIRKLKDEALARIPIVALSANAFEKDKLDSLQAGMNAHLTKPLDMNVLLETMAKFITD